MASHSSGLPFELYLGVEGSATARDEVELASEAGEYGAKDEPSATLGERLGITPEKSEETAAVVGGGFAFDARHEKG